MNNFLNNKKIEYLLFSITYILKTNMKSTKKTRETKKKQIDSSNNFIERLIDEEYVKPIPAKRECLLNDYDNINDYDNLFVHKKFNNDLEDATLDFVLKLSQEENAKQQEEEIKKQVEEYLKKEEEIKKQVEEYLKKEEEIKKQVEEYLKKEEIKKLDEELALKKLEEEKINKLEKLLNDCKKNRYNILKKFIINLKKLIRFCENNNLILLDLILDKYINCEIETYTVSKNQYDNIFNEINKIRIDENGLKTIKDIIQIK
jgi:flagellar biosynthesis GTPase FlhF